MTDVIPDRMRRAIDMPLARENTAPARPYWVALVRRTASSMLSTGSIVSVGPKVSSVIAVESSGTSTRIVGCTYRSPTASGPPSTARPPRATASSMWLRMIPTGRAW